MKINLKPLTCEKARYMMSEYMDGELKAVDITRIEAHLHTCEDCRKELSVKKEINEIIRECAEVPPASLKLGVMKKISGIPQETAAELKRKRLVPAGIFTAAAAALTVLVVGRVFLLGGAMNDADNASLADIADIQRVGLAEAYAPDGKAEAADEDAVFDGSVYFTNEAPEKISADKAAPEAAVEIYAVTSAIKAAAPGYGLVLDDACDYAVQNEADRSDKSSVMYAATTAAPSPIDRLFEKFREDVHAIIVCGKAEITLPEASASEDIVLFNTRFTHLTFTDGTRALFSHILEKLDSAGIYYRAVMPEGDWSELHLFLAADTEDAQ